MCVAWEMAFFMVLLGWSWGAGLWLVFAKSVGGLREGDRVRGDVVLVRDTDVDDTRLGGGKGGCGRRGHSPRAFLRLQVMNGRFTMNPHCLHL